MIYRNFNFENDQKGIKEAEEEDDISNDIANHRLNANHKTSSNGVHAVLSGSKRSSDSVEQSDSKKCRTDVEHVAVDGSTSPCSESETNDQSDHKGNGDANSPSGSSDEEFCCTACDKVANEVHTHPLLKVIVCRNCKYRLDEKMKETVCIFSFQLSYYFLTQYENTHLFLLMHYDRLPKLFVKVEICKGVFGS